MLIYILDRLVKLAALRSRVYPYVFRVGAANDILSATQLLRRCLRCARQGRGRDEEATIFAFFGWEGYPRIVTPVLHVASNTVLIFLTVIAFAVELEILPVAEVMDLRKTSLCFAQTLPVRKELHVFNAGPALVNCFQLGLKISESDGVVLSQS